MDTDNAANDIVVNGVLHRVDPDNEYFTVCGMPLANVPELLDRNGHQDKVVMCNVCFPDIEMDCCSRCGHPHHGLPQCPNCGSDVPTD